MAQLNFNLPPGYPDMTDSKTYRILVVDDEPLVRWSISRALQQAGYETNAAASAEEGCEKLKDSHVDLVITDMKLPKMDGFSVISTAREADPNCLAIMMSAFGDESTRQKVEQFSIDTFIDKPIHLPELVSTVSRMIRQKHPSD
jgi:two-component system response regulator AtoC